MKRKNQLLFIDFDGTLCHDKFWRSLEGNLQKRVQELLFGADITMVNDWMRGRYTSEEINRFIAKELKIDYRGLWEVFVNDCKNMLVPLITLDKINSLRQYFYAVLVTDNMDSFGRFTAPSLNLDEYFDFIINSYEEKKLKSDSGGYIFQKASNAFNIGMKNSLAIDDSKGICEIIEKLGGKAFLVSPGQGIDYYLDFINSGNFGAI